MGKDRVWILIAKKKNNEASLEELAELELLLSQNEATGYEHEVIEKTWGKPLHFLPEMNLNESTWNNIQVKISSHRKTFSIAIATRWVAAAVLVPAIIAAALFYTSSSKENTPKNLSAIVTAPISKQNFYLPDGSHVWLNGNSKITYKKNVFGSSKREINLVGEAFFDVVKNPQVPFVIHAGAVNITVKGTAFNVKAYPGQKIIETTLLRGLIEITTAQNPGKIIYVKPNEKITIPNCNSNKSQSAAVDTTNTFAITRVKINADNILPETVWMKDKLEFNNETFEDLAPEMESWFNVKIQFVNDEIKTRRFSGVIEKETLLQTLKAMQFSYHFEYAINSNEIIIQ